MSKYIANISDCCGCSVCLSVCQCMAITMKPNDLGFLYPCIDEDLCIECGDCKDVCPVLETNLNKMVNLFDKKAYTGYLVDNIELLTSTSGGFANAISKKIIEQGGCVFGVKYGDNFIPYCRSECRSHRKPPRTPARLRRFRSCQRTDNRCR